jgi:hypothetical protein
VCVCVCVCACVSIHALTPNKQTNKHADKDTECIFLQKWAQNDTLGEWFGISRANWVVCRVGDSCVSEWGVLVEWHWWQNWNTYLLAYFLTYLNTYFVTLCSWVLLERLTISHLVKKFPSLSHSLMPTICPYPEPAQSSSYLYIPLPEDPAWHYPPIYARVFHVVSFPQVSHQNPVYTSLLPHNCYMPHPSHSSPFYQPNNIGWAVQIMKLPIV